MTLWSRVRSVFQRGRLDGEMAEEMRFHLEAQEAANRAAGMSPQEARRAARLQFGPTDALQEECRDGRPFAWVDNLVRDIRFGLRMIAKSPGSTAVIVLTLGFGIAVNTTVFSMLQSIFLDPLPLPNAGRLVVMAQQNATFNMPTPIAFGDFKDYRARSKTLTNLSATCLMPLHLSSEGKTPIRTWATVVSPGVFSEMGVTASLGRTLLPSDGEDAGGAQVAVISRSFWKAHFASDPDIVGKTIRLNGQSFTVVGVGQEGFRGFSWSMDFPVFVPSGALPALVSNGKDLLEKRWSTQWRVIGRLRPGETMQSARAELAVLSEQIAKEFPQEHKDTKLLLFREQQTRPDASIAGVIPAIGALFSGMVALVLLIACANVANLMTARMLARRKELVMRSALGATRGRLIAQLLAESVTLALMAGAFGWVVSQFVGAALSRFTPQSDIPIVTDLTTPPTVYLFTVLVSIGAGVVTGLVPAWRASRVDLAASLNESGGTRVAGEKHRMRNLLVFSQITASCVVLVVSAVFLRSLFAMKTLDLGFRPHGLLLTSFNLDMQGYNEERGRTFQRELLDRVRALPGVKSASLTELIPMDTSMSLNDVHPENPPAQLKDGKLNAVTNIVDPSYFGTMGIALRKGRFFTDDDRRDVRLVAVVNSAMAEQCWPGQDPIGKRFRRWGDGPWVEVVGVTGTGKYVMLSEPPRPAVFYSSAQVYGSSMTLLVATALDAQTAIPLLREAVRALDPDLPLYNARSLEEHLQQSVFGFMPLRMGAAMAGIQGAIALLLGVMGLYSVVAYGVAQRTREIGVRVALGATRRQVLQLVMRDGARLTALGLGIGLVIALAFTFLASHVLYGTSPFDLSVYLSVVATLGVTTAAACYLPAMRATRINPVAALRHE